MTKSKTKIIIQMIKVFRENADKFVAELIENCLNREPLIDQLDSDLPENIGESNVDAIREFSKNIGEQTAKEIDIFYKNNVAKFVDKIWSDLDKFIDSNFTKHEIDELANLIDNKAVQRFIAVMPEMLEIFGDNGSDILLALQKRSESVYFDSPYSDDLKNTLASIMSDLFGGIDNIDIDVQFDINENPQDDEDEPDDFFA